MNEKKEYLLDSWCESGTNDKKKLYSVLEQLSKSTYVMSGRTDNLQFFTHHETKSNTELTGYLHNKKGTKTVKIPNGSLLPGCDVLLREMENGVRMMFFLGNRMFFTTPKVFKTLSQRAGSACGDFVTRTEEKVRFHRDAGYAAYMAVAPCDCKIVYRKQDGAAKVFAVFANSYQLLPQYPIIKQIIEELEKEMGESDLVFYSVDNFNTEIYIDFPKKAKDFANVYSLPDEVIPGIRIHLSDTGESSVIINGTVRYKRSCTYIPDAEYKREHTKNASLDVILAGVDQKVFCEYTKIPEQMVKLLGIDIPDPKSCIEHVLRYTGIAKIIGKKAERSMLITLTSRINASLPYTAYDIAGLFLEISEDICQGRNFDTADKVRSALTKALWYKY